MMAAVIIGVGIACVMGGFVLGKEFERGRIARWLWDHNQGRITFTTVYDIEHGEHRKKRP